MAQHHHYVERDDTGSGVATGMVLAIVAVLLIGILALFLFFGGPGRFMGGTTTAPNNTTNVNVPQPPAQSQPQNPPQINVPPRVDVNVQPPAGQDAQNLAPRNPAPQNPAPQNQGPQNPGGNPAAGGAR